MKKLNMKGFANHLILPIVAIVAVGGVGAYVLTQSHAATPYVTVGNFGSGAQPNIIVRKGETKSTGTDVNSLTFTGSLGANFCGHPNSSYYYTSIYQYNYNTGNMEQISTVNTWKASTANTCKKFYSNVNLCNSYTQVYLSGWSSSYGATYVKTCTLNNTSTTGI